MEGRYGPRWDSGDAAGWVDLFMPDGVFEGTGEETAPAVFRGRAELQRFCEDVTAAYRGLHVLGVPSLHLEGDVAHGRIHFQWIGFGNRGNDHAIQRQNFGYYDVRYEHTAQGWRMMHRREKPTSTKINETFGM